MTVTNHPTQTYSGPILRRHEPVVRRTLLMIGMYLLPASIAIALAGQMGDPDLWTHLKTGQWIVENQAAPYLEVFSLNPAAEHWVAYSWLYDLLIYGLYSTFGLSGQVLFALVMALAITFALYQLLHTLSKQIALSVGLTALGIIAMSAMLYGRSAMFSYVFTVVELYLLYQAVLWQRYKLLWALPALFVLWANLHIQFVYGLFVYGCFVAQAGLDYFTGADSENKHLNKRLFYWLAAIGCVSLTATFVTPYGIETYQIIIHYIKESGVVSQLIQELQAPDFRDIGSFAFLALVLATTWAVARKQIAKPFWLLLFGIAVIIGFRSARDIWFAIVTGLPLIALAYAKPESSVDQTRASTPMVILGLLGGIVYLWLGRYAINESALAAQVEKTSPLKAVEFISAHNYPGPLYNHYNWGSFLLWRLPQYKVSIDGRTHVHGSESIRQGVSIWTAVPEWQTDPELAQAGIIIGPRNLPLSLVLECNPRFKRVYQDDIASVFISSRQK